MPEEKILNEGDVSRHLFFIIQGECVFNVKDENGNYFVASKLLVEGSSFGEIGLLYNCLRTGDVISKNFITLAYIDFRQFRYLLNKVRYMEKLFIEQVCSYNNSKKNFANRILSRIELFEDISL